MKIFEHSVAILLILTVSSLLILDSKLNKLDEELLIINNKMKVFDKPTKNSGKNQIRYHLHYPETGVDSQLLENIPSNVVNLKEDVEIYTYINNIEVSRLLIKATL